MKRFTGAIVTAAMILSATQAFAEQPAPQTQREVAQLLEFVARSGCEFNRNGSWYEAGKAREHLQEKYAYLNKRGQIPDAEAFIDRAASKSSISGRAYQVRCGIGPLIPSATWLSTELKHLRSGGR
jgi:hypothetical protein